MKLPFILIAGLLIHSGLAHCQTPKPDFFLRRYVTNIWLTGQRAIQTGVLFDLTDSTMTLAPIAGLKPELKQLISQHSGTLPPTNVLVRVLQLRTYRYSQMERVALHRRGHGGKGFLIGFGLGAAAGFISGDDEPGWFQVKAYHKAFGGSIVLSLTGLLIGGVMVKNVRAKNQSIAVDVPARFRKFTIVEQLNQSILYAP